MSPYQKSKENPDQIAICDVCGKPIRHKELMIVSADNSKTVHQYCTHKR